jgi:steroid delta-isomerase-like uncharacterized protein
MKKLAILIFMFLVLYACKGKVEINTRNQNEVLIKKYFEYFNAHNWDAMANMYSDTADFKDPTLGKEIVKQTKKQTAAKYKELAGIFPNIKDEVVNTYYTEKNQIVVEFVSSGTSADAKSFTLPICTIFTIENGKITKDYTYFDNSQNQ